MATANIPQECEGLTHEKDGQGGLLYCVDCGCWLCEGCWPLLLPHKPGRKGREGLEHERTIYETYSRLKSILEPNHDTARLEQLHIEDEDNTWFGVHKDKYDEARFTDTNLYAELMSGPTSDYQSRYPQLVSFVGKTNAGKSTLINMLIRAGDDSDQGDATEDFPAPIVGTSAHSHLPTSANVHLYADPMTIDRQVPLLFADCEGFEGGERAPKAIEAIETHESRSTARLLRSKGTRPLKWALNEAKHTRSHAVKELFPRMLYTFSDVVVFVLREADSKTFETSSLGPLLQWGKTSLETSVNQPTLPHAIVVLNASEIGIEPKEWEIGYATENLLAANATCLDRKNGQPEILRLAEAWRGRGRPIHTVLDLIRCYYSDFSVVRIPTKGRYQLLDDQIKKLRRFIQSCCSVSFEAKQSARMQIDSDELDVYIQSAFIHFTGPDGLTDPFDFRQVSLRHNPIPTDFGGHILALALYVRARHSKADPRWIFEELSALVASSILLNCARFHKGRPLQLFEEYESYCKFSLLSFCNKHVKCRFGQAGDFESDFSPKMFWPMWRAMIREEIIRLDKEVQLALARPSEITQLASVLARTHSKQLASVYEQLGPAVQFRSNSTCLCCLINTPQHLLPCGHSLCSSCVRSYGIAPAKSSGVSTVVSLTSCPLHPSTSWPDTHIVHFKPDHAGLRLLSLDGGGMRGIVELEVLGSIQNELGEDIPLQAFFDLIVGTSTGGIIALGFGVKRWTIRECSDRFVSLCNQAFTPRKLQSVPMLKTIISFKHAARYRTQPLLDVLKASLGDDFMFGVDAKHSSELTAKVAVTATNSSGKRAIVIATYNRRRSTKEEKPSHTFFRQSKAQYGMRVWEAAAATSAAPSYFKPFYHEGSIREYLDGAVYHNNPVRILHDESKLLWPDSLHKDPDLLLSIGTGQEGTELQDYALSRPIDDSRTSREPGRTKSTIKRLRNMFNMLHNRFDSILDAELQWSHYFEDHANDQNADRYVRINPKVGKPPELDAVGELSNVRDRAKKALQFAESRMLVKHTANILIATSFYYERTSVPRNETANMHSCSGKILCRFEDGSRYLRAFGNMLKKRQTRDSQFYFRIEKASDGSPIARICPLQF
ncbi:FabD/lysophospholipase-like protein [Pyrenochaeta sp. DS3sAY3a]|nr:FabD/lysophospholipase-like protein [Pyrenochaeta sp. DS3sAY3a]